ncbi:DNA repair protein RadC [SAR116 cluster bacterium]|nr:DNA repair protein RadC [SAR116 cluster bacterium]
MANSLPPKSQPPKVSAGKASGGKVSSAKAAIDHVSGHRARMREKLLAKGADSLSELELLEMLLYAGNTRSDTKPLAKNLIREFGSLSAVLRASSETLGKQTKMGAASIAALKIVEAAGLHLSHSNIHKRQVLTSWAAVQHYCINRLAHEPIEHFLMLCMDNRNRLIAEETLSKGTIDQTPVYVREVINCALSHHARAVILVHNHPSGETEPSRADIQITNELKAALALVTVTLHDHLIVAGENVVSFKSLGLL